MDKIITKKTFPYFGIELPASQFAELTITYSREAMEEKTKIIHRQLKVFFADRTLIYSKPI
jgi:hypothetical protein